MKTRETIAAIATGQGEGGIGIVRLSGPAAIAIAEKLWQGIDGKSLLKQASHRIAYGRVCAASGEEIDEALVSVMRAPKSYTREDVVEINCHGGPVPLRRILAEVLASGARLAEPGEFTRRAFLNGRIDLSQAEAVIDTIRARTDRAARLALIQLAGGLSQEVASISDALLTQLSHLEAAVDYSDEDIVVPDRVKTRESIEKTAERIEKLLAWANEGELVRAGIRLAIVGRPNVGKSSLLNALLKRERAIVTAQAGTTRDVIEESLSLKGVPFVLADTAGIRDGRNEAETLGVALSRRLLAEADLVAAVVDISQGILEEDRTILRAAEGKPLIVAANKADLVGTKKAQKRVRDICDEGWTCVSVSAKTGEGIEGLEDALVESVFAGGIPATEDMLVSNARHTDALKRALASVSRAADTIRDGLSEEFASAEIRDGLEALGEIGGISVGEEILDRIFSEFCIGK